MVELVTAAIGVVVVVIALWYGFRAYSSLQKYRGIDADQDGTATPVDGEKITVEGTVTVDEPAPANDRVESLFDTSGPFALFDWRIQSPQGKNRYGIDLEERTIKRKRTTIKSGVEGTSFALDDGRTTYRVDPEQLVESADGASLATVENIGSTSASSPLFGSDWATENVYLDGSTIDKPLDEVAFLADAVNDTQADRYRFGVRGVPDGESVAVRGEVTIEDGVPTLHGTEETALLVSDQGADGLKAGVRNTLMKQGIASGGALAVGAYLVYAGIWSVPL